MLDARGVRAAQASACERVRGRMIEFLQRVIDEGFRTGANCHGLKVPPHVVEATRRIFMRRENEAWRQGWLRGFEAGLRGDPEAPDVASTFLWSERENGFCVLEGWARPADRTAR